MRGERRGHSWEDEPNSIHNGVNLFTTAEPSPPDTP